MLFRSEELYQYLLDHNSVIMVHGNDKLGVQGWANRNISFLAKELGIVDSNVEVAV